MRMRASEENLCKKTKKTLSQQTAPCFCVYFAAVLQSFALLKQCESAKPHVFIWSVVLGPSSALQHALFMSADGLEWQEQRLKCIFLNETVLNSSGSWSSSFWTILPAGEPPSGVHAAVETGTDDEVEQVQGIAQGLEMDCDDHGYSKCTE